MKFHLYGTSYCGLPVDEYAVTNASGVASFDDVLIGTGYTLEEVGTPDRYIVPDNQMAAIEWNKVTNKSFDNDLKNAVLKDIFWEMNEISYETEEKTETVIVETDDGEGNIIEEEVEETTVYLYITVSHKTVEEMMAQYGFTEDQKAQVAELLAQDSSMWASVLYGIYGADDQIVAVALSQLGNVGGEPYWSWYGFGSRVEWCACFVNVFSFSWHICSSPIFQVFLVTGK